MSCFLLRDVDLLRRKDRDKAAATEHRGDEEKVRLGREKNLIFPATVRVSGVG